MPRGRSCERHDIVSRCVLHTLFQPADNIIVVFEHQSAALNGKNVQGKIAILYLVGRGHSLEKMLIIQGLISFPVKPDVVDRDVGFSQRVRETDGISEKDSLSFRWELKPLTFHQWPS